MEITGRSRAQGDYAEPGIYRLEMSADQIMGVIAHLKNGSTVNITMVLDEGRRQGRGRIVAAHPEILSVSVAVEKWEEQ